MPCWRRPIFLCKGLAYCCWRIWDAQWGGVGGGGQIDSEQIWESAEQSGEFGGKDAGLWPSGMGMREHLQVDRGTSTLTERYWYKRRLQLRLMQLLSHHHRHILRSAERATWKSWICAVWIAIAYWKSQMLTSATMWEWQEIKTNFYFAHLDR